MKYIAVNFKLLPHQPKYIELLAATLDMHNFEGIYENNSEIIAYIATNLFNSEILSEILDFMSRAGAELSWTVENIPEQNWNALWESNFEPVLIDTRCVIRAPFHNEFPDAEYQITIEPKMSFGTGHHQTTRLMIEQILGIDMKGKSVLDMGCGTGVLAILAAMRGAKNITAIDIDEWACENTIENAARNKAQHIKAIQGGKEKVPNQKFDIILANINRNILIDQMNIYTEHCKPKGLLLLSGILLDDRELIAAEATDKDFRLLSSSQLNKWLMLMFERI